MGDLKVGDRIEYLDALKFQFGAQRTNHQGTVVDIVRGEAGRVMTVFSEPDEPFQVAIDGMALRVDHVDTEGDEQLIRKVASE